MHSGKDLDLWIPICMLVSNALIILDIISGIAFSFDMKEKGGNPLAILFLTSGGLKFGMTCTWLFAVFKYALPTGIKTAMHIVIWPELLFAIILLVVLVFFKGLLISYSQ
jgi:hypothetical protein